MMPSLVLGQSLRLVRRIVAVQQLRVLLVMSRQALMVAVRAAGLGAAVSSLRWALSPTDLLAAVEAEAVSTNLFLILCETRRRWCPAVALVGAQPALAHAQCLMAGIRIGRRVSRQPPGAVSELQTLWLCQLRQQLGLFFRHFFCAPLPPCAALLLLVAAVVRS